MNRNEITKILAILQSRYPTMKVGDPAAMVSAWLMSLDDIPYEAVEGALQSWFKQSRWAPDPSELRQHILSQMNEIPDAIEAWDIAVRHMRANGLVGGKPFAGPAIVDETVRAIGGWYHLRMSNDANVDREAFIRAYATYSKRRLSEANVAELIADRAHQLNSGKEGV